VCRTFILASEADVRLILQTIPSGKNDNRSAAFSSRSSSASSQDSFSSGSYSGKHFLVHNIISLPSNQRSRKVSSIHLPGVGFPHTVAISPHYVLLDENFLLLYRSQCFRSGSGFNQVSGSGSGFGIRIRIRKCKSDPQKYKK